MAVARSRRPYTSNKEYIRIHGDCVEMVNESVTRVVKLGDFMSTLESHGGLSTPILPNGCKLYRKKDSHTTVIIEHKPAVKQLTWTGMHEDAALTRWKLAFPFTIFVLDFVDLAINQSRMFYRVAPLTSLDDRLLHTNLCNVGAYDIICTGSMRVTGNSIAEKAEEFVTQFWNSTFNTDLWEQNFRPASRVIPQVLNVKTWQDETEKNSLFPLTVNWLESYSVNQLLEIEPGQAR